MKGTKMSDREYYEKYGEIPETIMPYSALHEENTQLRVDKGRAMATINTLERENEYLQSTLQDIAEGLDALWFHLKIANGLPDKPDTWTGFGGAFEAIRITQTELRNIIDEWES